MGSAVCESMYNIYLSLCTRTADPNPFRGTHCTQLKQNNNNFRFFLWSPLQNIFLVENTHVYKKNLYYRVVIKKIRKISGLNGVQKIVQNVCTMYTVHTYRPFHKTLPRASVLVNWISVRFYEKDCILLFLSGSWPNVRFIILYQHPVYM